VSPRGKERIQGGLLSRLEARPLSGKNGGAILGQGRIEYSISLYKFIRKHHSGSYYNAFVLVRVCKALLFFLPATLLPFVLCSKRIRRKYRYYGQLLLWHLRGRPDDAGLRVSSRG